MLRSVSRSVAVSGSARLRNALRWRPEAVALTLLALVSFGISLRRRLAHGPGEAPRVAPETWGLRTAWCLLLGHAVVIMVSLMEFRSDGGNITQRYLIGLMPALAALMAVGVLRLAVALPWSRRERWEAVTALLTSAGMLLTVLVAHQAAIRGVRSGARTPGLEDPAAGWPWPELALGLPGAAALGFLILRLRALGEGDDEGGRVAVLATRPP